MIARILRVLTAQLKSRVFGRRPKTVLEIAVYRTVTPPARSTTDGWLEAATRSAAADVRRQMETEIAAAFRRESATRRPSYTSTDDTTLAPWAAVAQQESERL